MGLQGKEPDLKSVVSSLKSTYGVDYVYCWHGLPAYWSGISLEVHSLFPVPRHWKSAYKFHNHWG